MSDAVTRSWRVPAAVSDFLPCASPDAWFAAAARDLPTLLLDHANCEKKAASTALGMMFRYELETALAARMSRLAREELRHFEQVEKIIDRRSIARRRLAPSRYASALHRLVRADEPSRLIDRLIIGAFIEARSCERFARIAPMLDAELAGFYQGLLNSESRHFTVYLELARAYASDPGEVDSRVAAIGEAETELITEPDTELRFHSGPPIASNNA
ncbi:MAG: tRNA isopentenyl-2-thiomethyl-A-37 hydroxylase MiaE [Gammaproteobacteria bacterium]